MKIVYLTWGETPRSYGVFGAHVVSQFAETKRIVPDSSLNFISAVPILNSGLVREKWRYLKEIKKVRDLLGDISFSMIPIFAPQTLVHARKRTFGLFHGYSHIILARSLAKIRPDIVHCRSVHATWAALKVRDKYKFSYKVIFDARGLWPEETAFKLNLGDDSADFKFLKNVELECLHKSDASITVSRTMQDWFLELGAKNDRLVYFGVDEALFMPRRSDLRAHDDTTRFCYVGALAQDTWHSPDEILKLYSRLRIIYPRTELTIVTTSSHSELRKVFREIPIGELKLKSTKSSEELASVLESQDIGLVAHFVPKDIRGQLLAKTAMAIKTTEYLAAGLPIICSVNCGGAAALIREQGFGVVYDPEDIGSLSEASKYQLSATIGSKCREYAKHNLTRNVTSKKYVDLYRDLIANVN